jgi:hypothetical protein
MACPGSIRQIAGRNTTSFAAAEGTVAHDIAARHLRTNASLESYRKLLQVVDGFEVTVDQEMIDGVRLYVEAINDDAQPGDEWWYEMPLEKALKTLDPDFGGTADAVRYRPSTKSLRVFDFKYGKGTYIESDDNPQLKTYGLGVALEIKRPIKDVMLTIVQPRFEGARPIRDWIFPLAAILDFAADLKEAAAKTRDPKIALLAGEHCQFCPAAVDCPELQRREHALTAAEFAVPATVTPEQLASALGNIALVKARVKAIEEEAYAQAQRGVEIPGYKLVDKRPTRRWKSDGDVIEWAQNNLSPDPRIVYAPRELLSPAQLEEVLRERAPRGKKKEAIAVLAPFIESKSSGTALVPVSDDRPPAKQQITAQDFPVVEGAAKPNPVLTLFN